MAASTANAGDAISPKDTLLIMTELFGGSVVRIRGALLIAYMYMIVHNSKAWLILDGHGDIDQWESPGPLWPGSSLHLGDRLSAFS